MSFQDPFECFMASLMEDEDCNGDTSNELPELFPRNSNGVTNVRNDANNAGYQNEVSGTGEGVNGQPSGYNYLACTNFDPSEGGNVNFSLADGATAAAGGEPENYNTFQFPSANQVAANPTPRKVLLRPWIKQVLHTIGDNNGKIAAASPEYLQAALRIAKCLTEQIVQAEKFGQCGIFEFLDQMPISSGRNWAEHIVIHLKEKGSGSDIQKSHTNHGININNSEQILGHQKFAAEELESKIDSAANESLASWVESLETKQASKQQTNEDVACLHQASPFSFQSDQSEVANLAETEIVKACQINEPLYPLSGYIKGKESAHQGEAELPHQDFPLFCDNGNRVAVRYINGQSRHSLNNQLQPGEEQHLHHSVSPVPYATGKSIEPLDYLAVDTAEIECPGSQRLNRNDGERNASSQRMYYLGLVFYELFSGGQPPPDTLYDLPLSQGAFGSLSTLTLVNRSSENQDLGSNDTKRRRNLEKIVGLSCEYLRLIGTNGRLCSLVFNMLDCVYGDLSGKECYTKMSDVTLDFQLMIDKPNKFLQQPTSSNLDLNEMVIPRDEEFRSIVSCYHRTEIVIVSGASGVGKSWLAQRVGSYIVSEGGIFLTAKFDELHQVKPFSALASVFDQFCSLLMSSTNSAWVKLTVKKLNDLLAEEACHLIHLIPKLGFILEKYTNTSSSSSDLSCRNAQHRLHFVLCRFLEAITTSLEVPLAIFLDDVQWSDESSIAVLNKLLSQGHPNLFFLACCRNNEMPRDHPFWNMLENVRRTVTIVKLDGIKEDVLNDIMSNMLCISPRIISPLASIVHNKTKGNILFFSQLMLSLHRDGLLYFDLSSQRWEWNEDMIYRTELPEDTAKCFANSIYQLPMEIQSALHTLSLFGSSAKLQYIEVLESKLGLNIIEPLKGAEGLVIKLDGSINFCHDRIHEASYGLFRGQGRQSSHLLYGRCLAQHSLETDDGDMLVEAVNHINIAGASVVSDKYELITFAKYNLSAGKTSMALSDFSSAYSYFNQGISFLDENHWTEHYDLSIEIFERACQCALATGNLGGLRIMSDEILENVKTFDDKINTHFIIMTSLAYTSKVAEALVSGIGILVHLGEDIPMNPSPDLLTQELQKTQTMIRGLAEQDFLNFPRMTDTRKKAALRFLAQLQSIAFFTNPILHTVVTLKMVQTTMTYGISDMSAVGFAFFGSYLATCGNISSGHCFTLLGQKLLERLDMKPSGELLLVVVEVKCATEPLLAANEAHVQGESAANLVGDSHWACLTRFQYYRNLLWSGAGLSIVNEKVSKAHTFMLSQRHKTSLGLVFIIQRTLSILLGDQTETLTTNLLSESISDGINIRHKMVLAFHNLYLSVLFNGSDMKECCESFLNLEQNSSVLLYVHSIHCFIVGLASFHLYRLTGDLLWADRGKKLRLEMERWLEQGSTWNFKQKLSLMQAEEHFSSSDYIRAKESYNDAINYARLHRVANDEALACELAARFYLKTNDIHLSLEHFTLAYNAYNNWGANGKANRLLLFMREKFGLESLCHTSGG